MSQHFFNGHILKAWDKFCCSSLDILNFGDNLSYGVVTFLWRGYLLCALKVRAPNGFAEQEETLIGGSGGRGNLPPFITVHENLLLCFFLMN